MALMGQRNDRLVKVSFQKYLRDKLINDPEALKERLLNKSDDDEKEMRADIFFFFFFNHFFSSPLVVFRSFHYIFSYSV